MIYLRGCFIRFEVICRKVIVRYNEEMEIFILEKVKGKIVFNI